MFNVFVTKPTSAWRTAFSSRHRVEVGANSSPVLLHQSCEDPVFVVEQLQWGAELLQSKTRNLTVEHNVVWSCGTAGIIAKGEGNIVRHNTLLNNSRVNMSSRPFPRDIEMASTYDFQDPNLPAQGAGDLCANNLMEHFVTGDVIKGAVPAGTLFGNYQSPNARHELHCPPTVSTTRTHGQSAGCSRGSPLDFRPRAGSVLVGTAAASKGRGGVGPDIGSRILGRNCLCTALGLAELFILILTSAVVNIRCVREWRRAMGARLLDSRVPQAVAQSRHGVRADSIKCRLGRAVCPVNPLYCSQGPCVGSLWWAGLMLSSHWLYQLLHSSALCAILSTHPTLPSAATVASSRVCESGNGRSVLRLTKASSSDLILP